ncbi:HTH-type transcriptional regulator BetI [Shimia sp. SK013]|uniref:TetR/AcrR family transcriptional regulator n=1 Tax=Shimia sp. SK013 TaxID=1389006 RepID=UPI0006B61440|nr:TetR/AcrR family transcriptional regulator [Shimia sp. SK013]KPA20358.1 HTH-type transcriptional regulator BetI [Shimia sp. SK013]
MRDKILEATAAMLVEHGTQASMARIASRAGVATGSLYNHFENKDVLIRAVYDNLARVVEENLVVGDDPETDAPDRLARYIDNQISFFWARPEQASLFEYLSNVPLLPAEEVLSSFERTSQFIRDLLIELQAEGWLIDGDVSIMGGFIGGAIRNTLKWQRTLGAELTDEKRTQLREMCLQALRRTQ